LVATVSARALMTGVTSRQSAHSGRKPQALTVMTYGFAFKIVGSPCAGAAL
jgi:hypothetical protein